MKTVSFSLDQIISDSYQERASESPLLALSEAEIILGQDFETHKVFVVDGKEVLHSAVHDLSHESINVVVVQLKRHSDQLRQLRNIIDLAKCRS
ncbi:hypothetical protein [Schlesneria paludicola]|uniref:hypothetical protein n=1 Tax=Schlesneria paludicola TaxID=360056 RepID=UPI00029AEA09|nr:hypothetical protein [Schlesneria paludicola]